MGLNLYSVMTIFVIICCIFLLIIYKDFIFNILSDTQKQILVYICLILYGIKDILIYIYNIYELDNYEYFSVSGGPVSSYENFHMKSDFKEKDLSTYILNMDKDNRQGSSKNPFPNSSEPREGNNSPINYGDFDWSSDSDSSIKTNNNFNNQKFGTSSKWDIPSLPNIPQIKSPLEAFKESIDKATPKELEEKINDLNNQLDMYLKSGLEVPAAKIQIKTLEEKLNICFNKVCENPDKVSEDKVDLKGKGKEIDLKGKGKAE